MERALFIQHEIGNMYMDDFCVLPLTPIVGSVVKVENEHYQRMSDCFNLTH